MQRIDKVIVSLMLAALWAIPVFAAEEPTRDEMLEQLSATMRGLIEPAFIDAYGFGYTSFDCTVETNLDPGSRFDCQAVDQEGDRIRYTFEVDDDGMATVVQASQSAADLSEEDLASLEPPCRRFLSLFAESDWDTLIGELHPALLETVPPDAVRSQLAPVRRDLGQVTDAVPMTYATNLTGRQELEYRLECANGPAIARLGFSPDDDQTSRIIAFLVTPAPGTPLHTRLLEAKGRELLGGTIDAEIVAVELPFDRLERVGDAVEGTAKLADGREIIVGVVLQGRPDDFDTIDYHFYVLDVPFLLQRASVGSADPAASVECPTMVAPDGGALTCHLETVSGSTYSVTVARSGGDHNIVGSKPAE